MTQFYYDTGVLLKLYTTEPESNSVRAFVVRHGIAIRITDLHLSEAVSAFRLKEFRGECSKEQASAAIACIEEDIRAQVLRFATLDWPSAWIRCQTLAQTEVGRIGTRTLDTLHVSCAMSLHATSFITTDQRQAALARVCGLKVVNPCA